MGGIEAQLQNAGVDFEPRWSPADVETGGGLSERDYQKSQEGVELLRAAREWLARGNTKPFQCEVDAFLEAQGVYLDGGSKEYRKASLAILRGWVRSMEATQKRNQGEIVDTPPAPEPVGGLKLSEVFGRWEREHKRPKKTATLFWARITSVITALAINRVTHDSIK